jgi:hypothetical protein
MLQLFLWKWGESYILHLVYYVILYYIRHSIRYFFYECEIRIHSFSSKMTCIVLISFILTCTASTFISKRAIECE